ncbi:hypothetical protein GCM10010832_04290 [Psychroflexus planctonicus]|uniref:Uncharacterized protein n=1 Tax=Psychroflexus planctonicus TaxID=1526575 RepID=A0ABQ1SFI4_9FLAO|nr:hypothetical protein GCM10010832_04290 [Psychroflexus planctonicus]
MPIQDKSPYYGNPKFKEFNNSLSDFTPQQIRLVKNRGISIPKIPSDSIGLVYGLQLQKDILGNKIKSKPSLGAIEVE